ncbi:MAG: prepilin-type N-terminal cleavage/methylation domain-containing protein [Planctomycetota bacterium]|jgi:prepilin-type N-terminal cleavage/methylation domain-containing protein
MNYKLRTNKAFTLIELLVAIGILAMVLSFASVIFRVSINAQRTAIANVEIMQKLRAITNQLNADFKGLRKDGEIFMIWAASPVPGARYQDNDLDGYERFDRIMFFADGDFQSYRVNPMIRGNVARVAYILARRNGIVAQGQPRAERILVRTQHIMTADPALPVVLDPNNASDQQWYEWNSRYEYDKMSLDEWKMIPSVNKADMLSVICDVRVEQSNISEQARGAGIDPADPNSIHMLLCEGVGEFKIQSWYDAQQRWVPDVDPDGDGTLLDTDFMPSQDGTELHSVAVPGVLYPYPPHGRVQINNISYPDDQVDEEHFDMIPGLGRALKFTFTLFDSKGIIKEGRTFTHIVYLGG